MKRVLSRSLLFFLVGLMSSLAEADTTTVQPQLKSPGRALAWSLFGTLVPTAAGTALFLSTNNDAAGIVGGAVSDAAIFVGPSLGYFYGGLPGRAWKGIIVRTGVYSVAFAIAWTSSDHGRLNDDDPAVYIYLLATSYVLVRAIVDVAQVDGAVRKRNEKLQNTGWLLTPKYFAQHKAPGLELQLRW